MIKVEDIHELKLFLMAKEDHKEQFIEFANGVLSDETYTDWIENDQFAQKKFEVPTRLNFHLGSNRSLFDKLGLIKNDVLQVKLDKHGDSIHLTDGLWIPSSFRVFPFTDESEKLITYVKDNDLFNWPDVLIDPATGCGHHVIALSHIPNRIALDINVRAIAYCDLNRILNNSSNLVIGVNDIREGFPKPICDVTGDKILFLINMPFALSPVKDTLPLSADGGETGSKLTLAAMKAVKNFAEMNKTAKEIRLCILNYTIGNIDENRWQTVEFAKEIFGSDSVSFHLLQDEKMWRINGKKEQNNPMDISKLHLKAECKFYVNDYRRDEVRTGYKMLETKLHKEDWNVLGYGILDIVVK